MYMHERKPCRAPADLFDVHIPTVNHTQALKGIMLHNCFALSNPQSLINGVILPDAPCCSHGNPVAGLLHTWHWNKSRTKYLNLLSIRQTAIDNGITCKWKQMHTCTYTLNDYVMPVWMCLLLNVLVFLLLSCCFGTIEDQSCKHYK